jgi:hypothetical protein
MRRAVFSSECVLGLTFFEAAAGVGDEEDGEDEAAPGKPSLAPIDAPAPPALGDGVVWRADEDEKDPTAPAFLSPLSAAAAALYAFLLADIAVSGVLYSYKQLPNSCNACFVGVNMTLLSPDE